MRFKRTKQVKNGNSGFTLIELMVAIAIVAIVLTGIVSMFQRMSRSYTTQNVLADLQQGVRSTLDVMGRDIRIAGYDKYNAGNFGVQVATTFQFRFTADRNENQNIDTAPATEEIITYLFSPGNGSVQKRWSESTGQQTTATLLGGANSPINVLSMSFVYMDENNAVTTNPASVRAVIVTLMAEAPAGRDGLVQRTFRTRIECRNAGI